MDPQEYIATGILELYVYGLLSEAENEEVYRMEMAHRQVEEEIVSIEKAIINISTTFSPFLSVDHFSRIKSELEIKHGKVSVIQPKSNLWQNVGWAAALVFFLGIGYFWYKQSSAEKQMLTLEKEKTKLEEKIFLAERKSKQTLEALGIVRDIHNKVVALAGQSAAPKAYAKVYWNKETHIVYVDAAGLPGPPKGMVYQVWSLKLSPTLIPTSIGLLQNFSAHDNQLFLLDKTSDAEAFGITLEPAGGSKSPTMKQLFTLGKV